MLQKYVPNVLVLYCSKCFYVASCKCLSEVIYVAMTIHVCCNCIFQKFRVVFKSILQVFYLNIAYVVVAIHICSKRMLSNVLSVLDVCCNKCFMLKCFH
jgi:hypothetical protein